MLSSEATEIDNKTFTEQELLEGLDAHTAHADELADLIATEVDLDETEEDGSHEKSDHSQLFIFTLTWGTNSFLDKSESVTLLN